MRAPSTGFRSAGRGRDASPDSAIFTNDSNFSLFSSASASVERCSFASDSIDPPDSLASQISLQLAGSEDSGSSNSDHHESSSGPDRRNADPNKPFTVRNSNKKKKNHSRTRSQCRFSKKGDKTKATIIRNENIEEDSTQLPDSVCQLPDSARSSFSLAVKECQERRSRSEFIKKLDRQRPASLDLNNVVVGSSPRTLKKDSIQPRKSVPFPSPGTPIYCHTMQKGWSSERVPLHVNGNRRSGNGAALMPLGNNVKTLPSKWEDAERWICSPVSGDGLVRTSIPPQQRRPKSKSGPLGPPGIAYYSLFSPALPVSERGNFGSLTSSSPFSAGVITADGFAIQSNGHGSTFPMRTEPCMARSVSVHGCTEMVPYDSLPSQDENGIKDAAIDASRAVSRRDMATQMSPEGSNHSSPARTPSFSTMTPSALPIVEMQSFHSSKLDVKDVQVDEKVTMTRWSKKHRNRNNGSITEVMDDWRKRSLSGRSSAWDASETTKSISKVKRQEAKITAWENLQKAKAEAAIRKLEMKLEKKRSSSMDKIMNKLRSAQKRAQEMRNSVLANQAHQDSRTLHKALSLRRSRQMSSLSGCFTCHAF